MCEIYSNSQAKWFKGKIVEIFKDAEGQWFKVSLYTCLSSIKPNEKIIILTRDAVELLLLNYSTELFNYS